MPSENVQLTANLDAKASFDIKGNLEKTVSSSRGFFFLSYSLIALFIIIMYIIDCFSNRNLITEKFIWIFMIYFMVSLPLSPLFAAMEKPFETFLDKLVTKHLNN